MAEDADDSEKSEEPSDRKKQQAYEQGQIAYSRDIGSSFTFFGVLLLIYYIGTTFYSSFKYAFQYTFSHLTHFGLTGVPILEVIYPAFKPLIGITLAIMGVSFLIGLVSHIVQKGIEPKWDAAAPDLEKLSPAKGFSQLVSLDSLVNNGKNIVKTLGFLVILVLTIRPHADKMIFVAVMPFDAAVQFAVQIMVDFVKNAMMFLITIAALDYYISWRRIHKSLMMSRQDLKEESKDSDGNPEIKGKLRQIQRERAKRQAQKEVPNATVIVTNPTHFAVALKYEKGKVPVPKVVAKGVDAMALKIREIATTHKVPIIENPPLARALYRDVKAGKEIPSKYYKTVAKIIATILRLEEEKKRNQLANRPRYKRGGVSRPSPRA